MLVLKQPRGLLSRRWFTAAAGVLLSACSLAVEPDQATRAHAECIGLDLVADGAAGRALTLARGPESVGRERRYYIDDLRLRATVSGYPASDVLEYFAATSFFRALDWAGAAKVHAEWAVATDLTYTEIAGYSGALWMHERPTVTVELLDDVGAAQADPITVSRDDFVFAELTALTWATGAPAREEYGQNSSAAAAVVAQSGGSYHGDKDDAFDLTVSTAGTMDGTAVVTIKSVVAGGLGTAPVTSGDPIALGSTGVTVTLTAPTPSTSLKVGDRFVVRVVAATGAVGAATPGPKARFAALAQVALRYGKTASPMFSVPDSTTQIRLTWTELETSWVVPVTFVDDGADPGLVLETTLSPPENREFYVPGETLTVSVDLFDRNGNRLHPEGSLPTYAEFRAGSSNGIAYYDLKNPDQCLPYFNSCFKDLMETTIAGPTNAAGQNYALTEPAGYFLGGIQYPPMAKVQGGRGNPALWDEPVPSVNAVTLPEEAEAGTYLVITKAARKYLGESTFCTDAVEIQIGDRNKTTLNSGIGNCDACHLDDARLANLRHGVTDGRWCSLCHERPRATGSEMVHGIHFYAAAYPLARNDCSWCHISRRSNDRASEGTCKACHGAIHPDEPGLKPADEYARCAELCHRDPIAGHVDGPAQ
ncbi:MAG: hypothetical protein HY903_03440 [Deltaproteobacteria bacterium]|nr:hypothetical protein [Deltaproteobacteria bacterium]